MIILINLTIPDDFYDKFATFTVFVNFLFFCKKSIIFSEKKTFWEIVIFQSHSTTILLCYAILKNSCFLWKNSSNFSKKKSISERFENFYYICRILRQTCQNWHILFISKQFFQKPTSVSNNHKTWRFWDILHTQSLCTWSFLHLAVYITFISVFVKPICIFGKNPTFESFEKFY